MPQPTEQDATTVIVDKKSVTEAYNGTNGMKNASGHDTMRGGVQFSDSYNIKTNLVSVDLVNGGSSLSNLIVIEPDPSNEQGYRHMGAWNQNNQTYDNVAVKLMSDKGYDSYGIDISDLAIELTQKYNVPNCKVGSLTKICYPDAHFHAILCTDVLEHVARTEITLVEAEFDRVLKPKGTLFLNIALTVESNRQWRRWLRNSRYKMRNLHTLVEPAYFWKEIFPSAKYLYKYINETPQCLSLVLRKR